jgi:hypothetical protein
MPERPHTLAPGPQRDEAAGYRPVAGLAIAALIVAGLTGITVLSIAVMIGTRHRPILSPLAVLLAAAGLMLSTAAWWQIRRSEGTRTGFGLTRIAFWVSLLSLGGYGAYYFAIDWAVHKQAETIADQFLKMLAEGKPELAFRLTRPPGQQRGIETDANKIRARFGSTDLHFFDQSDLTREFRTWKEKARVQFKAPGTWEDKPDGFLVVLNYSLRTPEGLFDLVVFAQGFDDRVTGGDREWQIIFPGSGLRQDRQLTKLGRLCDELQGVCMRNYLRGIWVPALPGLKPEEVAAIVRIDGAVPREEQRKKLIEEVQQPSAINLIPGSGPSRQPGMPTMYFDADGVRLVQTIQVNAPIVDAQCPAVLTIQVVGEPRLMKELLDLAGPDWEKQPFMSYEQNPSSQLAEYKFDFKVTELNFRPGLPRIAPARQGS